MLCCLFDFVLFLFDIFCLLSVGVLYQNIVPPKWELCPPQKTNKNKTTTTTVGLVVELVLLGAICQGTSAQTPVRMESLSGHKLCMYFLNPGDLDENESCCIFFLSNWE